MTWHRAVLLALVLPLPAAVGAQQPPSTVPELPPIGLPLAPIGLPPPVITPPRPFIGPPQPARPEPRPVEGRSGRRDRRHGHGPSRRAGTIVMFVPALSFGLHAPGPPPQEKPLPASAPNPTVHTATGRLRVDVEPADAQIFVDGIYAGTPADRNAIALDAGVHRLELRARGYETASLDVQVTAHQTITYRGALIPATPPLPAAVATPPQASSTRTVYLLEGCYLGDVPPDPSRLPARCDVRQTITYTAGGD